jgi:hypothetical protein
VNKEELDTTSNSEPMLLPLPLASACNQYPLYVSTTGGQVGSMGAFKNVEIK